MAKKKSPKKNIPADKVVNSTAPAGYFEAVEGVGRVITPRGRKIDLSKGVPADALELYKSGFIYLKLKKGGEVLFQEEPNSEIERLINIHSEDVLILKKALKK